MLVAALSHDVHDKLGHHLIGTALVAQALQEKLAARYLAD
jgi:signal transduction histidine kinase